jgi:hydrogenase small subunit
MESIKVTRRQFLKWLSASAAALGLSQTDLLKVKEALAAGPTPDPLNPLGPTGLGINGGTLGRVIWISGAACSGCPTSLLNYIADPADPDPVLNTIANNAIPGYPLVDLAALYPGQDSVGIDLAEVVLEIVTIDWAQIVMAASGDIPNLWMKQLRDAGGYVLMTEGAIQTVANGRYCRIADLPDDGTISGGPWDSYMRYYNDPLLGGNRVEMTMAGATLWLAQNAVAVIALGTCASYGGIPAAKGSVTGAKGTWEWINGVNHMNKLVVNIPGCPPHPDWFVATAGAALLELNGVIPGILTNNLNTNLDHLGRPKNVYTGIYHQDDSYVFCQDCPRRPTKPGPIQPGPKQTSLEACRKKSGQPDGQCLENNGCCGYLAGPKFVRADCPTRKWNNHTNWPVGNNFPCSGCTDPGFPDKNSPFYQRTKNP